MSRIRTEAGSVRTLGTWRSPLFVLGNFVLATANLVHAVFQLAWFVLLARIVLSWVRPDPPPGIVRSLVNAVYTLTDPVLDRARRLLPFLVVQGIDLTPIAVFLGLGFLDRFVTSSLLQLGASLG
jgi:YggT family protein